MGLWDQVRREVQRVVQGSQGTAQQSRPTTRFFTPEDQRGPLPDTLLTTDDMEAATGQRPMGEPDRKGGGSENDTGYTRVCEWKMTGDDELLINLCRIRGAEGLALVESRRDWFDDCTPIEGLGDDAWFEVTDDPQGRKQLSITARQGMYKVSLVHSSRAGATDITPLKELMGKVLSRLD